MTEIWGLILIVIISCDRDRKVRKRWSSQVVKWIQEMNWTSLNKPALLEPVWITYIVQRMLIDERFAVVQITWQYRLCCRFNIGLFIDWLQTASILSLCLIIQSFIQELKLSDFLIILILYRFLRSRQETMGAVIIHSVVVYECVCVSRNDSDYSQKAR